MVKSLNYINYGLNIIYHNNKISNNAYYTHTQDSSFNLNMKFNYNSLETFAQYFSHNSYSKFVITPSISEALVVYCARYNGLPIGLGYYHFNLPTDNISLLLNLKIYKLFDVEYLKDRMPFINI